MDSLSRDVEIRLPLPMAADADTVVMRLDPVAGLFEEVEFEVVDGMAVVKTAGFSLWATLGRAVKVLGKAALCKATGLGGDGQACCFGQCFGARNCNPPPIQNGGFQIMKVQSLSTGSRGHNCNCRRH